MTYTCALLQVNPSSFADITARIKKINENVGGNQYGHMFHDCGRDGPGIDLTHIMIVADPDPQLETIEYGLDNIIRHMTEHKREKVTFSLEALKALRDTDRGAVIAVEYS